jgi:hypothetical protein
VSPRSVSVGCNGNDFTDCPAARQLTFAPRIDYLRLFLERL